MRSGSCTYRYRLSEAARLLRSWPEFSHVHYMATYVIQASCPQKAIEETWNHFTTYYDTNFLDVKLMRRFGRLCEICKTIHYNTERKSICRYCYKEYMRPPRYAFESEWQSDHFNINLAKKLQSLSRLSVEQLQEKITTDSRNSKKERLCFAPSAYVLKKIRCFSRRDRPSIIGFTRSVPSISDCHRVRLETFGDHAWERYHWIHKHKKAKSPPLRPKREKGK